jgi:WD40 repeat protein
MICVLASQSPAQQSAGTDAYQDALPQGAIVRLGNSRMLAGYVGAGGMSFTPDGKRLLTTATLDRYGAHQHAQIWDAGSGKLLYASPGGLDDNRKIAVSGDGKLLAVNGPDGLLLQDARTGQKMFQLADPDPNANRSCQAVYFTPDSSRLVAVSAQDNVFWDAGTGKKLFTMPFQRALTFSRDSKRIAGLEGADDRLDMLIFDADGNKLKTIQIGKSWAAWQMAFAGDDVTLAVCKPASPKVADSEDTVWLLNSNTGEKIRSFAGHPRGAFTIAISADAKVLATADWLGVIRIFNAATGELLRAIRNPGIFGQLAISPDGGTIAAAGQDGAVRMWDAKTGRQMFADRGHQGAINAVAISSDGRQIATASRDGTVRLWDAASGKELMRLEIPETKLIATSDPASEPATPAPAAPAPASAPANPVDSGVPAGPPSVLAVAFSADNSTLAASTDKRIALWRLPSGELAATLPVGAPRLKFSADGKNILTPGPDDSTLVWDIAKGELARKEPKVGQDYVPPLNGAPQMLVRDRCAEPIGQFSACVWSVWPTGHQAKPGLYATVVEQHTLQPIAELTIQPSRGMACFGTAAFSPDARLLATAGCDGPSLAIWDLPTAQKIRDLDGHMDVIFCLAFAPSGKTLVSAGMDGSALIWDVNAISKRAATASAPATRPSDLATLVADLAGEDATKAYLATLALADLRDNATDLLATKLSPVTKLDAAALTQVLADLDSRSYAVRKKAAQGLDKLGPGAVPAMREALASANSAEVKAAIQGFLARQDLPAASRLEVRAIYVLERIGTDKARQVLKSLAQGLPDALLTTHATASLQRLSAPAR